MQIEFLGAAHEVTGSCHYVTFGDKHVLVDCGMEQGPDLYVNQEIPVNAAAVDYVFVTHAHIDHSGLLPLLYNHGFRGQIFATEATTQLCNIMLKDSAHIQMFEAEWKNRKAKRAGKPEVVPMYDMNDAMGVLTHFVPCEYNSIVEVCDGLKVRFVDAGHLLGSSSIEMWIREDDEEAKVVFSGDIGSGNRPLIKNPQYIRDADYVVMESTYGDKEHETPPDYAAALAGVLKDTFTRGGNLVIPAFSVGRTQEMLYFIRRIKTEHLLPEFENFPVFVDSPLAVEATTIFNKNVEDCFSEEALNLVHQGINPIGFPGLRMAITSDESKMINFDEQPKVIISASGMCEAGRIRHHLKHNLWRKECTILFVGYQANGTLGRRLLEGEKNIKLFGEPIEVHARIESLHGISGHAHMNGLIAWLKGFKTPLQHVFVVHGEDTVTEEFAQKVEETLGCQAGAALPNGEPDLAANEILNEGVRIAVKGKKPSQKKADAAFERLIAAGRRLLGVIYRREGIPNKDKAKFESQINNLADKWDRWE